MFLKNRYKTKIRKTVVKIPSDIKYIRKVSSKVLGTIASYEIDESLKYDIRLCVEEALINAIVHGNRGNANLPVEISYWVKDGSLNIEVEDKGSGFDHSHLSDPTVNDNIMKGSGRGVYLIRNLMNEVEYNDVGNKLKMIKHL